MRIIITISLTFLIWGNVICQEGSFKDERDGRVYKTVKIGDQVWMAENLNVGKFCNGDNIIQSTTFEDWKKAGEKGFLALSVPENYGGLGINDFRYNSILIEEMAASGASGLGFVLHNDVALPYFEGYSTEEQKERWLPQMVSGETITALAMTEPGGGSDLANIKTTAKFEIIFTVSGKLLIKS